MIGNPAIVGRQPRETRQPHNAVWRIALKRDLDRVVLQLARDDLGHARAQCLVHLRGERLAGLAFSTVLQGEGDIGTRHGEAADDIEACDVFAARCAQEFAARWYLGEDLLDPHTRADRQSCGFVRDQLTVIDHTAPTIPRPMRPAFESQPGDACD